MQINEAFKSLIPPLSPDEYRQLEENILSDGIRDPLVLWGDTLIDGHNRYEIARKHGLTFQTVKREFDSEGAAQRWVILNQFGRRNLSAYDRSVLALKLKPIIAAEAKERQGMRVDLLNIPQKSAGSETRDELAKVAGVSHDTIAKVEKLESEAMPEVKAALATGDLSINAAYDVTRMTLKNQCEVAERIKQGEKPYDVVSDVKRRERAPEIRKPVEPRRVELESVPNVWLEPEDEDEDEPEEESVSEWEQQEEKQAEYELSEVLQEHPVLFDMYHIERKDEPADEPEPQEETPEPVECKPHIAYNSGNNEWYTPAEYIEAARAVMGGIDLDPASSEIANRTVKASAYYTAETNGLDKPWSGNVWLNPPYASDLIGRFMDKLTAERETYSQAVVLVNNATETEWFFKLVSAASAVVFPKGRVKFYKPDGETGAPLQGQAVVYIGDAPERFLNEFRRFGWGGLLS